MISYIDLGYRNGLGNWLFQYAFLRTSAQRLRVPFYCPEWLGDHVFLLNDQGERAAKPEGITRDYHGPSGASGYSPAALDLEDGTNICGYFQSERYFNNTAARKWYSFREEKTFGVEQKYQHLDFSASVGLHLRFGDKKFLPQYVIPGADYYIKALEIVQQDSLVLIFSDEPQRARKHLKNLPGTLTFMEGNEPYEDLYLMTRCRDFVCSTSTLCWWAAWLNGHTDKTIVAPKEWFRPGYRIQNNDLSCDGWKTLKTCTPFSDDYRVVVIKNRITNRLHEIKNRLARISSADHAIEPYSYDEEHVKPDIRLGLITRCRNDPYVYEFVNHYINEGVDEIFIIDDRSRPGTYESVAGSSFVHVVTDISFGRGSELNMLYRRIKEDFDWILIVDLDEYVTANRNTRSTLKRELLTTFRNADCVKIPWVMMAFNGIDENPDSLLETNTYRWNHNKKHKHSSKHRKFRCRYKEIEVKCVFRTRSFEQCWDHGPLRGIAEEVRVVDAVHNQAAIFDPYHRKLREEDIARAFLLCFHYRVVSKQHALDKLVGNNWPDYKLVRPEDLMSFDFPEIVDETLCLKSKRRPKLL